jgi:copper homeostasis protein
MFVLEVIVCSVADAIQAKLGGASRLEVVRELDQGGLTPPLELVSAIQDAVDLPLRVMVRESVGYEAVDAGEVEKLVLAAEQFEKLGVDGVVIGFLQGREIYTDLTRRILKCVPNLKATFHHAFEGAADQFEALRQIKKLSQVDRVLSHGGPGDWMQRTERLAEYAATAAPELTIIAGGGITEEAISLLRKTTSIREFHVGRAARSGFQVSGDVQAELVRRLVDATRLS